MNPISQQQYKRFHWSNSLADQVLAEKKSIFHIFAPF